MSDLDVTAFVTRDELDAGPLNINDGENFILAKGLQVGKLIWRKDTVTSPYVHGRFPVREVMDAVESTLIVYALGSSHAVLTENIGVLIAPFTEQSEYELQINVEGQSYHWRCERADYEVAFATETLNALLVPVQFTIYRSPIAVAGVI